MLQLIASSGALLLIKSALLGARIATLLIVAKICASDELASLSFAIAMAEMARMFADFGTETWSVRAIAMAKDQQERTAALSTAAVIKLSTSLTLWPILIVVCARALPDHGVLLGAIAGALVLTSQASGLAIAHSQATDRIHRACALVTPYAAATVAAVAVCVITWKDPIIGAMALTLGETAIACSLLSNLYRDGALNLRLALGERLRSTALACLPTAALGIVVGTYGRLDMIFLSRTSLSELALYTVAYRLFQPFQVAITTFGTIVYAKAALAMAAQRHFLRSFALRDLPTILGLALVVSALLLYAGSAVIQRVLSSYLAAVPTLQLLSMTLPLLACNAALTGLLLALGRFTMVFLVAGFDLIAASIAMAFLVPSLGALGAAQSLAIGATINLIALSLCIWATLRTPAYRSATTPVSDQHA